MKTTVAFLVIVLVPALCLKPNTALAQESGPMINGSVSHGGFGGPVVKLTTINSEFGVFVGGRGGWIVNFRPDHSFVLGGGGYSLATEIEIDDVMSSGGSAHLNLAYGGLELAYVNRTRNPVHFSVHTLIGGGGADHSEESQNLEGEDGDPFFVVEPGISAILNVAEFFRIEGGVSYRLISGTDLDGVEDSDLSGASAVLTFKFGSF